MKVHLIGICGTGMGSLAGLLKAAGHDVRGSDEHVYPPMSTQLAEQQIPVFEGFGPANLAAPMITVPDYIDMVVNMLIAFGLSFQLPLVVMALVRVGILEIDTLKKMRRYVYFIIAVVAALIIPDVVAGWFLLLIPLIFLYEFGLYLAARTLRLAAAAEAAEAAGTHEPPGESKK